MSLAADVVRSFIAKCAAEERINLLERELDTTRAGVKVLKAQYKAGAVGDYEYRDAEANLRILQSSVPQVRAARDGAVISLAVLRGLAPSFDEALDCPQNGFIYRQSVGLDNPEDLLKRRPDIIAAEARLKSAVANVGDQVAQLFPKLNLLGSLSFEGATFDALVNDPTKVFSYGPTLTWRPLSALTLVERADAAKAQADSFRFDYQSAALKAVGEVERSMGAYKAARKRFGLLLRAVASARRTYKVAESRFNLGSIDALELSRVEKTSIDVELELLAANEALNYRLTDLVLALGVQA
jgi:multidrug efflux system outer membrane protein